MIANSRYCTIIHYCNCNSILVCTVEYILSATHYKIWFQEMQVKYMLYCTLPECTWRYTPVAAVPLRCWQWSYIFIRSQALVPQYVCSCSMGGQILHTCLMGLTLCLMYPAPTTLNVMSPKSWEFTVLCIYAVAIMGVECEDWWCSRFSPKAAST